MKKQLLTGLSLLILSSAARAQSADRQVLGSSGGSYSGAALAADYTTGEVATQTGSSGSFVLSQGFQQPGSNGTGISDAAPVTVDWKLYPNPAGNSIILELNSSTLASLQFSLSSVTGQLLRQQTEFVSINGGRKQNIDLSGLAAGIYFVNLYSKDGEPLQSIRFQKQ